MFFFSPASSWVHPSGFIVRKQISRCRMPQFLQKLLGFTTIYGKKMQSFGNQKGTQPNPQCQPSREIHPHEFCMILLPSSVFKLILPVPEIARTKHVHSQLLKSCSCFLAVSIACLPSHAMLHKKPRFSEQWWRLHQLSRTESWSLRYLPNFIQHPLLNQHIPWK